MRVNDWLHSLITPRERKFLSFICSTRPNDADDCDTGVYGTGLAGVLGVGTAVGTEGSVNAVGGASGSIGIDGETNGISGAIAGYFDGNVDIVGTVTKGGGSFKIDDPLDPSNKYLYHSFVESPDMKDIYDGIVELDSNGTATVELPPWFESVNQDFRYQLTPIGSFAPLYIAAEIQNNAFSISGGLSGMRVSWTVTGIRHDAWANAHRIPVEIDKPDNKKGTYLYPAELGMPQELNEHQRQAPTTTTNEYPPAPEPVSPF